MPPLPLRGPYQSYDCLEDMGWQSRPTAQQFGQCLVRAAIVQPAAPMLDATILQRHNLRNGVRGCESRHPRQAETQSQEYASGGRTEAWNGTQALRGRRQTRSRSAPSTRQPSDRVAWPLSQTENEKKSCVRVATGASSVARDEVASRCMLAVAKCIVPPRNSIAPVVLDFFGPWPL